MATEKDYSDAERALLTEEELAGLAELDEENAAATEDEGVTEAAAAAEDPAPAAEAAAKEEGAAEEDPPAAPAPPAASPGDKPAGPQKPADPETPAEPQPAPAPKAAAAALPKWQAPADVDQQIGTVQSERDALAQKFDDGELTGAEYRAQDRELEAKVQDLREQRLKASMSQESTVESWKSAVGDFLSQPEHGIYEAGSAMNAALDMEVRKLQVAALEQNGNQFDPAILEQAHENVQAQIRKAAGLEPAPKKDPAPAPGGKPPIPPTLGQIPASDPTPASDGGEYAALDRLTGEEYEAALARLSPEARDRYLAQ